ncbi:MAG: hypothetical protein V1668_02980 [Patescibacteria group bacterium]
MAIQPKNPHDDLTVMKQRVFMWTVVFVLMVIGSAVLVYFVFIKDGGLYKKSINANISTNTAVNRGQPSNQDVCSKIVLYEACDSRSDCLPVDKCGCTTEDERERRCGQTPTGVCNCIQGGFDRCEKLICNTK